MNATMAPISPSSISPPSLKRPSPAQSDEDISAEPSSKRRRIEHALPLVPPTEDAFIPNYAKAPFFDDDPHQLLLRSIAIVLRHVGFDGASKEALEAFSAEVETYASHFLSEIRSSMLTARRAEPIPLDFEHALSKFDLRLALIRPHLKPPVPASEYRVRLEAQPFEGLLIEKEKTLARLLGGELSGEPDQTSKPYIPKKFAAFPSKHTYKWTEKEPLRLIDPRKIREEAAKSARYAEESLRRLVRVGKAGKEKSIRLAASRDPRSKERHELWEKTMEDLVGGKGHSEADDEEQSLIVNAGSQYFRKGPPRKKRTLGSDQKG